MKRVYLLLLTFMLATGNVKAIAVECDEPSFLMSPPSEPLPALSHPPVWDGGHQPCCRCYVGSSSRALLHMILCAVANTVVTSVVILLHQSMIAVGLHAPTVYGFMLCLFRRITPIGRRYML